MPPVPKPTHRRPDKQKEWLRAHHSVERVEWVQRQPCLACGASPCHNHHIKNGGAGRKADYIFIVPLCPTHHNDIHRLGKDRFSRMYRIELPAAAILLQLRWEATPH